MAPAVWACRPTVQRPGGSAHKTTGQRKTPGETPGGSGFLWSVNALLLGHGSGTAERCTDDGDDGKDFHG